MVRLSVNGTRLATLRRFLGFLRWGLALVLLVAAAALSPRLLPFDMDEFAAYQPLGCLTHPLTREANTFRETCGEYDLTPPLLPHALPLRSYRYIGSLPAVPFAPLWWLIGSPVAGRIQGALFLAVAVFLTAKLTRARLRNAAIACFLFPLLVVAFIVDTGPVGLSVIALLATLLGLRASLEARAPRCAVALALATGLSAFCGLWVKLVFVWWIPAIILFAYRQSHGIEKHRALRVLGAFGLAAALPSLALLASRDHDGLRYANVMLRRSVSETQLRRSVRAMLIDLVDSSRAVVRQARVAHHPIDGLPAVAGVVFIVVGAFRRTARGMWTRRWAALAVLTLALMIPSRPAWPHHFAYALFLFVLALTSALEALESAALRWGVVAGGLAMVVWISLGIRSPGAIARPGRGFDKDRLGAFVRAAALDRQNVEVHVSWGTFYISHLFDDSDACVLYARGTREEASALSQARRFADALHRGVLIIREGEEDETERSIVARSVGSPLQTWRFGDWSAARYVR